MHPLIDWILPYEGLAVSVEGKDALFLRRGVHPLMDWILPYEGLAVSVEGKDALFLRAGVHPFHGLNALFGG